MADITDKTINIIIGIILVFLIVSSLAGTILSAANNITTGHNLTGEFQTLPLAPLFGAGGVVLVIVMIAFMRKSIKMANQ